MNRSVFRDPRTWLLGAAFLLVLSTLLVPRIELERQTYDLVAIVDVTGSMNVRDMAGAGGKAISRLDAAKAALRELLVALPCRSRLGLGMFTERRAFLFFEPVDTCENFAVVDDAIAALDWRMAWEGDSYISKGFFSSVNVAESLKADLIFMTDGHEAPPLPASGVDDFEGKPGAVRGLIVGMGGRTPVAIPKYDDNGQEDGVYSAQDVPQENRAGPPPADASSRPGWHPRNAPFGANSGSGTEQLSSVRDEHLKHLASIAGLSYTALIDTPHLAPVVKAAARAKTVPVMTDSRPFPALLALALLAILYGALPLLERWWRRRRNRPERRAPAEPAQSQTLPPPSTSNHIEKELAA